MVEIMTVCGAITPESLGFTSMHEHILSDFTVFRRKYEELVPQQYREHWDEKVSLENLALHNRLNILTRDNLLNDDEALMTAEVADFKASGGDAMVDQNSSVIRVDLPALRRISQKTGVHIVTTAGFYIDASWPDYLRSYSVEQLTDLVVKEIEEGIGNSGIRAGHIKAAVSELTECEERGLKAAARASNQTGLSVTVHPGFSIGNDGRRITEIMLQEGMKPERLIIAHADGFLAESKIRTLILYPQSWGISLDYHHHLLDKGVNIAFDCFGLRWSPEYQGETLENDIQRLAGVTTLVKEGYSSQLVLGTDTCYKTTTRRYGGFGYCRLTEYVIPALKDLGVSDYDIRQMTIHNPARLLAR